jgi:serine/threonine protein kinase
MPIESLDKNEFTHKSDIFAIGVVFYEMLHGTMPWEATSQPELIYKLRYIPYKVNEALSEKSKAFLKAALERNVEKRMD